MRDKVSDKSHVLSLANKLTKRLSKTKTLFIINDYIDVALLSGADGVHLGQQDLPLRQARKLLGKDKIIGISCHNLRQALKAQKEGADYIGIGPIYPSATKPEYRAIGLKVLRQLKDKIKIPYFAIGNIHADNIKEIIAAGARRIAVCRAILKANHPNRAASQLSNKINESCLK
ncbi:MAG: thiamine phosphate synthase [Candidatus Omnitrophica bacterium]|nr:thiamine phosphate synthase [Candidatus Omnitrophota bacterium]MBU1924147.1 thiamine phosphate synthase [Candidatus Omnitrophota bacterium]